MMVFDSLNMFRSLLTGMKMFDFDKFDFTGIVKYSKEFERLGEILTDANFKYTDSTGSIDIIDEHVLEEGIRILYTTKSVLSTFIPSEIVDILIKTFEDKYTAVRKENSKSEECKCQKCTCKENTVSDETFRRLSKLAYEYTEECKDIKFEDALKLMLWIYNK